MHTCKHKYVLTYMSACIYVSSHFIQRIFSNSKKLCIYDYLTDLQKCVLGQFSNVSSLHNYIQNQRKQYIHRLTQSILVGNMICIVSINSAHIFWLPYVVFLDQLGSCVSSSCGNLKCFATLHQIHSIHMHITERNAHRNSFYFALYSNVQTHIA